PRTSAAQYCLPPGTASPDQFLAHKRQPVDDFFTLGVLLLAFLPLSLLYRLPARAPAAAERIVCHQGGRKPSSVRGLTERTRKELTGDLDRIVLMAMESDPSRRYLSAQHFEEDLHRFLQGKPVVARKATPIYRLSKLVQRHKTASLVTCAAFIALCGAILFDSWQSRLADRRVKQVETLADSAISDLTEKLEQSTASTEAQASLFHSSLKYLEQLRQSFGNDPRLLLKLSKAYERVGDLEGSPFVANLGNARTAVTSYQEALRMAIEAHAQL